MQICVLLVIVLFASLPGAAAAASKRIAVIVANSRAGADREALRYAARDAREIEAVLSSLGGVGDTRVLIDRGPEDLQKTWLQIERESRASKDPVVLLFYYSGHADDRALLMGDARYDLGELRKRLEALPVRLFVAIVDACRSGAIARLKGGTAVPVVELDVADSSPTQAGGIFITSGAPGEAAQESDEIEGSFFTHALVTGLRGAADESGDRRVSLEEAYRFAYTHTLYSTRGTFFGPQHPTFDVDIEGQGQLVLTWLRGERSYLVLPEVASGHWLVRSIDRSAVFAEVEKVPGRRLRLVVDPGKYEVSRIEGDKEWAAMFSVSEAGEVEVLERDLRSRPLVASTAKGSSAELGRVHVGYRARSGYLTDMNVIHGLRAGYSWPMLGLELGVHAAFGVSRYVRRDGISVALSEVELGLGASYLRSISRGLDLVGGLEVGAAWAEQRGSVTSGASERRGDFIVPFGLRGGTAFALSRQLSLSAIAGFGGVALRRSSSLEIVPAVSAEVGFWYTP
jgi:hypothetical protein